MTFVNLNGPVPAGLAHVDLGSAVTTALRDAIVSGRFVAGERLVETELAEQFGTSRGPIRDALAELERTGLVELRPRKGSFVRTLTPTDVEEVYSLRITLESMAIRLTIEAGRGDSIGAELLDALESAHSESADGEPADVAGIAEADMALHRAVVSAAGHQRLLDAWEALADQTMLMMATLPTVAPDIQGPMGAHTAIVEALAADDVERASAALVEHLTDARAAMVARYG